ncbi:hypothetical protein [Wenxinia saemankumensis]|uniref:Response regulatory domain-containing protein n=1 Tax=Wenxinia saemankumensis TaxID=1447782 RepID=A0A1M6B0F5_9RHOB|nr:hypothetical protein [Wenxinia saemankumensis]SHI42192.1 hypothetical protein SAMN05444417_0717 [Wenxinia saemankumensis]
MLVLEDEAIILLDLELCLEDAGARPLPASDLAGAMGLVEDDPPDVAILDVSLAPGVTSRPVAERLIALGVPFLLHTGDNRVDRDWMEALGVPVLRKPVPSDEVVRRALALLRA